MIFVTVGTHEQQFNRLVKKIDELKGSGIIKDDVIIQTGYTDYEPKNCESYKFLSYDDMNKYNREAKIVITHGGPSSFLAPIQIHKVPVVVPRKEEFGEHVNNHQVDFTRKVKERFNSIILVEDINDLKRVILNYETLSGALQNDYQNNNDNFCNGLNDILEELIEK